MKEDNTNSEDSSDADDATVAIWGNRRAHGAAGAGDAPAVDIWGSTPAEAARTDQPDSVDPPPDLWGDGGRSRDGGERSQGDRPVRFLMPATWAATPKRKPGWFRRLRKW
jgi:hypothetical protein